MGHLPAFALNMTQRTYIRHIEHTWAYMSIWFNLSHHNLMRLHQNQSHGHWNPTPQWSKNDGSSMFLNQTSSTPWCTQHPHNIPIVHSSMKGGPAFASTLEWDSMDRPYRSTAEVAHPSLPSRLPQMPSSVDTSELRGPAADFTAADSMLMSWGGSQKMMRRWEVRIWENRV